MVCCFFGHRTVTQAVEPRLRTAILQLLDEAGGDLTCYVGNQGQFDATVHRGVAECCQHIAAYCGASPRPPFKELFEKSSLKILKNFSNWG